MATSNSSLLILAVIGSSPFGTGSPIVISASLVGGLILGILFGAVIGACITCLILKRRNRKHLYTMFQGNILNSEQVDNRHFNTVYKDIDTVHELITNKAYGSPTVLGKTEAYGCSMEQGENNVYESLKEPSAYEISGDVAMNLYDNN